MFILRPWWDVKNKSTLNKKFSRKWTTGGTNQETHGAWFSQHSLSDTFCCSSWRNVSKIWAWYCSVSFQIVEQRKLCSNTFWELKSPSLHVDWVIITILVYNQFVVLLTLLATRVDLLAEKLCPWIGSFCRSCVFNLGFFEVVLSFQDFWVSYTNPRNIRTGILDTSPSILTYYFSWEKLLKRSEIFWKCWKCNCNYRGTAVFSKGLILSFKYKKRKLRIFSEGFCMRYSKR